MTFFFDITGTDSEEKADYLYSAICANDGHEIDAQVFTKVPGSPFAYWLSSNVRMAYAGFHPFQSDGRTAVQGLATTDDFRFLRAWWEVPSNKLGRHAWAQFARSTGATARYYGPSHIVINWAGEGAILKALISQRYGNTGKRIYNEPSYFTPGFCWPLRGGRLAVKAVGPDSVFGIASKMAFVSASERGAYLALLNSAAFDALLKVQAGSISGVQYEAGLIARTPVPQMAEHVASELQSLARRAWSIKRQLDTTNETSHAFLLPPGLNEMKTGLEREAIISDLFSIQREIDELAFQLYGIESEDRAAVERTATPPASVSPLGDANDEEQDEDASEEDPAPVSSGADDLASWLVGVSFGRFDPRLATGERAIPPEPDPFDPLLPRSFGMYQVGEEPADRPDILVDDEGHPDDLAARSLAVAEHVRVDVTENLRDWLAKEFFPLHIKMYSKSRRKAPIYWQLSTPSVRYSVWLYIHAFNKDTLFCVQNDYIGGEKGKLPHEERRLESLARELRDGGTPAQRKELAAQESFVEELRAFLDEVKRVAPLWKPNLDDGVIINFAPLWRLVPQNKSWQKELKTTWDALCEGKYDWTHLAMHLWPERVVPQCAKDRSLAIAHELKNVFWVEGSDGKWTARKTPTRKIDEIVGERTSPAVKSALKSLLEAPAVVGTSRKTKKGKANA